jgi:hypothetical protein
MNIAFIEETLRKGQVPPPLLAEMRDWLSVESSSRMDRQDELIDLYADWFHANREKFKSEKPTRSA